MKHKLYVLILIFILSEAVLLYSSARIREMAIRDSYNTEITSLKQAYDSSISNARNISDVIFNIVVNNEEILSLFAQAEDADDAKRAVIRKAIYDRLKAIYQQEQRMGLKQLHFHLKDSTSFLRMHRPQEHGDSLLGVRYTVEMANREQRYLEGFEEGRIYNGFRFVYPLFYKMKHIGSVELSISSNFIVENMNTLDKGAHDFIIEKEIVGDTVFSSEQINYTSSEISENYLRETVSRKTLQDTRGVFENMDELFRFYHMITKPASGYLKQSKPFGVHANINSKEISAVFIPVFNVQGKHVAFFIKVYKDDKYHSINNYYKATLISFSLTIFFVLSFIYMVMANNHKSKMLTSILDEKLKEHESQLELKEQMLFQQSKLATLGEMFSALAHQWKQPLNILAMYVQNLLDEDVDEEEFERREEIVEKCMTQINYMSETINDFMDFIRPSENTELKMEMVKAVNDILKLLMPSLEKRKINVSVSSKGRDAVYAKANTNEIKHVLVNILNNAKDAIMDIKEKDRMFDGKITIEIESGENEICIVRITDNGGGINQSVMDKIFNPYVTTKLSKDGSGLGLYMCKTIIEKHKGTMSVKNTEGGASFEITLPGLG